MTWSNHQSDTAPYTIHAAFPERVKEVTDWTIAEGLYVEMPLHHDSWQWISAMPQDHDGVRARFDSTWKQITATFRNTSQKLLFESVNEPQFKDATELASSVPIRWRHPLPGQNRPRLTCTGRIRQAHECARRPDSSPVAWAEPAPCRSRRRLPVVRHAACVGGTLRHRRM
ncbi:MULTISPECIES: cellulase family glycosylhydrolase [unclassified Streptomyces]|uniref:cellulase family glycosylhydrolase n=1 Tax=unclassified Streptomyces TaxID=2593676 RepID=UPI002E19E3CB